MTSLVDVDATIPNNVGLADDRRLLRALESWQPRFLDWWREMGPVAFQDKPVYLRTAISVGQEGWANFGHVTMPDYRWGVFLAEPTPDRRIAFGDHKGEEVWQEVPGPYRAELRRLLVVQGDTEPASVEQQRALCMSPSLTQWRRSRSNVWPASVTERWAFHSDSYDPAAGEFAHTSATTAAMPSRTAPNASVARKSRSGDRIRTIDGWVLRRARIIRGRFVGNIAPCSPSCFARARSTWHTRVRVRW